MDSYVIRVYKREKGKGSELEKVRGVVEDPVTGFRWSFESVEQLWAIIGSSLILDNKVVEVKEIQPE